MLNFLFLPPICEWNDMQCRVRGLWRMARQSRSRFSRWTQPLGLLQCAPEYQHTRTHEHHHSYCKALPYRIPVLLQCTRTREHKQSYCSAPDLTFGAPRFGGAARFCQQTCTRLTPEPPAWHTLMHQDLGLGIVPKLCKKATQLKGAWPNLAKITREAQRQTLLFRHQTLIIIRKLDHDSTRQASTTR